MPGLNAIATPHNPPTAITLRSNRSKIAIAHRLLHSRSDIPHSRGAAQPMPYQGRRRTTSSIICTKTTAGHAAPHRIQMVTYDFQTVMFPAPELLRLFGFQCRNRDAAVISLCPKRVRNTAAGICVSNPRARASLWDRATNEGLVTMTVESKPAADASLGELLSQLSAQTSRLVRDELRLAQKEFQESAKHAGSAPGCSASLGYWPSWASRH